MRNYREDNIRDAVGFYVREGIQTNVEKNTRSTHWNVNSFKRRNILIGVVITPHSNINQLDRHDVRRLMFFIR